MSAIVRYKIKEIRVDRGISQRKLAELSGLSHSTISYIESGKREPTVQVLCEIALALQIDTRLLFEYWQL